MRQSTIKKVLMYVLCVTLIFAQVHIVGTDHVNAAGITTENLIPNGYFEDGLSEWNVYFNETYSGSASVTADYLVEYNINFFLNWYDEYGKDNGPVTWAILLENNSIKVEEGKTYKISFKASSSVKRPIIIEFGGAGSNNVYSFALDSNLKEYTFQYESKRTQTVNMKYHLGPISTGESGNTTGLSISGDDEGVFPHKVNIGAVSMVDVTAGDVSFVKKPGVIGVEDGATYKAPVSAKISYDGKYNVSLTKDGQDVEYVEDKNIVDDGQYVMVISDASNPAVKSEFSFAIKKDIDYSKKYYTIVSKATDKVVEVVGIKEGNSVVQNTFNGSMGQFFTLEKKSGDYYAITSLVSGNVIAIGNDDKLIQTAYTGDYKQQWKTIDVPQGFAKFQSRYDSSKVIDIPGANKTDSLQLQVHTNNGSGDEGQSSNDAQRFDLVEIKNIRDYVEGKNIDISTKAAWKKNAFITPIANELNPAGPIAVEWYQAPGDVKSYSIYFDGKLKKNIKATKAATMKVEGSDIYTTKVDLHKLRIVANYANGTKVKSKVNKFYVTKKGIGWGTLHRTADMNLSWYYRWSTDPAIGTDEKLNFVPMIWGNYGDEWLLNPENKKYGTVLSFNEPDWSDQSNVPVTKKLAKAWVKRYNEANGTNDAAPKSVEEAWQAFMDSGLRIGSPATALAPPYCLGQITMNDVDGPDKWWKDFEKLMKANKDKGWDYDFVAIHSYNGAADPDGFIQMVKDTYKLTGKPIWITEFGVADWGSAKWNKDVKGSNKKVIEFMEKVLPELDKLEYVERYAWFPFDPNDAYGGSSGLFDYDTGKLTKLGKTYAGLGLPEGYTTSGTSVTKSAKAKINKISCKNKVVKLKLKKINNVEGYDVRWSTTKYFKKYNRVFVKNKATISVNKFKKIKKGKKYYFKVRAYKNVNGKKVYGNFSKAKIVTIK